MNNEQKKFKIGDEVKILINRKNGEQGNNGIVKNVDCGSIEKGFPYQVETSKALNWFRAEDIELF